MCERLRDCLAAPGGVIITGDHGMVDIPPQQRIVAEDDPALMAGVSALAGEARFRQLYVDQEPPRRVADRWRARLGELAWVRTRDEAIDEGWFAAIDDQLRERWGHVLVALRGDWAVMTSAFPREFTLIGMHGSLTPAEMLVPLLVAGLSLGELANGTSQLEVGGWQDSGVAEFCYFTGPMDCGKSTLALQLDYTQAAAGRKGRLFSSHDRAGESTISSRLGLARPAIEVTWEFDFWNYVVAQLTSGHGSTIWCATRRSSTRRNRWISSRGSSTSCRSTYLPSASSPTFSTRLFAGSQRLVELCDRIEVLQVRALCWCGERATHNARTINGEMVLVGDQVVVAIPAGSGWLTGSEIAPGRRVRGAVSPASPSAGDTSRGAGHPLRSAAARRRGQPMSETLSRADLSRGAGRTARFSPAASSR